MALAYPHLFTPVTIGRVEIKNRLAMAPMGILGLINSDGSMAPRAVDYYLERAKGGIGLIITSLFVVTDELEGMMQPRISRNTIGALGELCEAVHSLGTKLFIQLTAGWGRVGRSMPGSPPPAATSAIPSYWNPAVTCRAMTTEEVEKLVKAFGMAAMLVSRAGVDGIELHGHEGYLFDQFTTAIWNRRTDKYGGNLKGRLTFAFEVLEQIKKRAGAGFPVQYRVGLKHYIKALNSAALPGEKYDEYGRDIEEGLELVRLLEQGGFDSLHVDAGCYDSWYWAHPPVYQEHGCMVDMAALAKQAVKIPVVAVGRLDIPEIAEQVIAEGKADMVAIGRGVLADPYWPEKVRNDRVDAIRPCIGCHDGCIGRFGTGKPLCCAVNPSVGRERAYSLAPATEKKRVVVIGGGISGMETARVAAARGHRVTLFEKEKSLGGHLVEASVPDFKKDLRRLVHWYAGQLENTGVQVKLGSAAGAGDIAQEKPDIVCIATGSQPIIPDLPGIHNAGVVTAIDLLLGRKPAGENVAVVGGGLIGCEVALWLAQQGKKVTVIEMLPELLSSGIPVPHMNRVMLLDMLALHRVKVITQARVTGFGNDSIAILDKNTEKSEIKADTTVLAIGLKPDTGLYRQVEGKFPNVYIIGDIREPRNIMGAIWDAYEVGRSI